MLVDIKDYVQALVTRIDAIDGRVTSLERRHQEFAFPGHEMAPQTAWVLANKHGVVLTRFWGLRPRARAAKMFEIAFFDSEEEAEGVHDAMGLRGTVRPQLVNRRTLEPVA